MKLKYEDLFSLPGVQGFGYGKKETKGRLTDKDSLVVFVSKKRSHADLKEEDCVPCTIDGVLTDVVEIGDVWIHPKTDIKQLDIRSFPLYYQILLGLVSQGKLNKETMARIVKILDSIDADLEKLIFVKDTISEFNSNNYRINDKSSKQFIEFLKALNEDIDRIFALKNSLLGLNYNLYRNLISVITVFIRNAIQNILNHLKKPANNRTVLMDPAVPGISIGHYQGAAGTFGAVVYDKENNQPLILSNNHVLANTSMLNAKGAEIGDPIVQPANMDGKNREIGKLVKYVALNPYPQANIVDCALAEPLDVNDIDAEILDIGMVKGVASPVTEMEIKKSGRTTALTTGKIRALDATININYGEGRIIRFEKQIVATNMSEPGDSGSLVLDMKNKAVGLLFAGSNQSTVINPIQPVLELLGVKF